jgi:tetratricopeptide (TPR) repeat protein
MAKIALRAYNHEIEGLIEQGQRLEEAVAHCRHILKTFPKYLETYRLLGKSYLEAKRYDQAVDIFQRVLVSAPEDFVSHVGMSIIADDQGKLDEAIWHMERAFEVQPSNAAIQAELQRLFGRRDGVEPPKIRLTRGALAHMYVQGELYGQAISEIKAVLGHDPKRTDLQVLLATAYFRNGQKTEAADACADLLGRFPYCFDANRLMVEILPGTQQAESADEYRQRVNELDPYAAYATESVFQTDAVAATAVTLDRLDYTGQVSDTGAALGIGLEVGMAGASRGSAEPKWLTAAGRGRKAPTDVPDFLREAGWSEADAASQEEAPAAGAGEAEPAAVPGDLPAWVKALAPSDDADDVAEAHGSAEPTPEWLRSGNGTQVGTAVPISDKGSVAAPADWSEGLGVDQDGLTSLNPTVDEPAPNQIPSGMAEAAKSPEAWDSESAPAWLKDLDEPKTPKPESPTWAPAAAGGLGSLGTTAEERDDAMAWLEGLAAKQGARPEEMLTNPSARPDSAPKWVDKATEKSDEAPDSWASLRSAAAEPATSSDADPSDTWLQPSPGEDQIFTETRPGADAGENAEPFDWLSQLSAQAASSGSDLAKDDGQSARVQDGQTPELPRPAKRPAIGAEPGWLSTDASTSDASESAAAREPASENASSVDLPDWLAGLDKEIAAAPAAATSDELPAWLRSEADAQPPAMQRAIPTDWQPAEGRMSSESPTFSSSPVPEALGQDSLSDSPARTARPEPRPSQVAALSRPQPKVVAMLPKGIGASLGTAQAELERGNIAAALTLYGKLIRKGKSLEDIIRDLRDALYRYPVEVPIWQALGDAYMRGNRLQEALDAYTKAEELLR